MIDGWRTCPTGGLALVRKKGRDRRGQQVCECQRCGCSFTHRSGTPGAGYRFPPAVSAFQVRYDLRYRLRCGDLAEGLDERGIHVDRSMRYDWVQPFPRSTKTPSPSASGWVRFGGWMRPTCEWASTGHTPIGRLTSTGRCLIAASVPTAQPKMPRRSAVGQSPALGCGRGG